MFKRRLLLLPASIAAAAFMIACGGGGNEGSGRVIEVKAEKIRYAPADITVAAGETVTIRLKNVDEMAHDLEVQGLKAEIVSGGGHGGHAETKAGAIVAHAEKNRSASVTFVAREKGTYEIWCTLPGHKELGMVGKLVVT